MKLDYRFELEDWMAFQRHHLINSTKFKRSKTIATLLPILIFGGLIVSDVVRDKFNIVSAGVLALMALLWTIFYPKRFVKRYESNIQNFIKEKDYSGMVGVHHLELTEDNIELKTPQGEEIVEWTSFVKLVQTETHYFLYNSELSAIIIPKENIANQQAEFDQFVSTYMPQ